MEKITKKNDWQREFDYCWSDEDLKNLHNTDKILRDFLDDTSDCYMPSYCDYEITYGDNCYKQTFTYTEIKKAYELVSRINLYGECHIKIK